MTSGNGNLLRPTAVYGYGVHRHRHVDDDDASHVRLNGTITVISQCCRRTDHGDTTGAQRAHPWYT